jgi:transposase
MAGASLANIKRFVREQEGACYWVGADVHKMTYSIALRRKDGGNETWTTPAKPGVLIAQLRSLEVKIMGVAYEAGPTGFGLARALLSAGFAVIVAPPSKIPRPVTRGSKTDRLDCLKLAQYLQRGLLRPVAIPTEDEEAKRALLRRRDQITDQIRRTKQRIKSFLLCHGIDEPKGLKNWSKASVRDLHEIELLTGLRYTLDNLLYELEHQLSMKIVVKKQLAELVEQHQQDREAIGYMRTIHGVGEEVATGYRMEIFQPERFNRGEEVTSYLGLAPVMHQSGQGKARGALAPNGNKRLRSLLVEAAWRWMAKDPWARSIYNRLLSNTGVAQKAIIGVARKLAVILWRLCLEQRPYRPAPAKGK